jgi:hypothetical protein
VTPEEYIAQLAKLKQAAEDAVILKLPELEQQAYALLDAWINANLDVINGRFVANQRATAALNNFTDVYLAGLTELGDYQGAVGQYLKNLKPISDLIAQFQSEDQGLELQKANLGSIQEAVVAEIINAYSENGLNPGFVQPLRQLLFSNITAGTSKTEALPMLQSYVVSGQDTTGKLSRYLEQTTQQATDSYEGAINTRIMQVFKIDTLIMSGSLIKTSSPQCRFGINELGGLIDRENWPELRDIAVENGLIEGTTFDNLSFNRLHWGCRHTFTPAVLNDEQRAALQDNPVNE